MIHRPGWILVWCFDKDPVAGPVYASLSTMAFFPALPFLSSLHGRAFVLVREIDSYSITIPYILFIYCNINDFYIIIRYIFIFMYRYKPLYIDNLVYECIQFFILQFQTPCLSPLQCLLRRQQKTRAKVRAFPSYKTSLKHKTRA